MTQASCNAGRIYCVQKLHEALVELMGVAIQRLVADFVQQYLEQAFLKVRRIVLGVIVGVKLVEEHGNRIQVQQRDVIHQVGLARRDFSRVNAFPFQQAIQVRRFKMRPVIGDAALAVAGAVVQPAHGKDKNITRANGKFRTLDVHVHGAFCAQGQYPEVKNARQMFPGFVSFHDATAVIFNFILDSKAKNRHGLHLPNAKISSRTRVCQTKYQNRGVHEAFGRCCFSSSAHIYGRFIYRDMIKS